MTTIKDSDTLLGPCMASTLPARHSPVITNGLLKSRDLPSKIAQVRGFETKLEGLEIMLDLNQIDLNQASFIYTQYLTEIPHV